MGVAGQYSKSSFKYPCSVETLKRCVCVVQGDAEEGFRECLEWLAECGAVVMGETPADCVLDCKASTGAMPDPLDFRNAFGARIPNNAHGAPELCKGPRGAGLGSPERLAPLSFITSLKMLYAL
jgi:hypothetical protein